MRVKGTLHGLEACMNREPREIRLIIQLLLYLGLAMFAALPVLAQVPVDEDGNPIAPLVQGATVEELDDDALPTLKAAELLDIVGPVALYPDDLLAIVLPASTYPLQIVQAARFLERLEADPSLKPDEEWDESITALLNYPEVVELMNEDIDWTWRLGEAVVAQQADVIAAIERFRDMAYAAGNLKTDDRQTVTNEDGVIEIEPANEDVIYVPYYEPDRVVVYQPRPVYHYYPRAYPVYYYPYPYGYSFDSGYFWGVTTAFTIGWLTDHLHVYHHSYWGHPYYGRHYYNHHYYRHSSLSHYNHYYVHNSHSYWNYRYRDGDYWRPARHGGARPGYDSNRVHYYRDRNRDDWRHRGIDSNATAHNLNGNIAGRQASNRDHNSSASPGRNGISFRSRDTTARADRESRRDTGSSIRAGFAPSSHRSTTASNNQRAAFARSSNGHSRSGTASNPRREVQTSPPSRESRPSSQRAPSRSQPQRSAPTRAAAQSRSQPQRSAPTHAATPSRSQPQRSAPTHAAAPSSAPQRSAGSSSRASSRSSSRASSRSSSHQSSTRGESGSRRRH